MSEPYTPEMIVRLLRGMADDDLARIEPRKFQTWPVRKIVKTSIIEELIFNERATRRNGNG